jgi:ABC-type phosphate transport system substrate-binding protein
VREAIAPVTIEASESLLPLVQRWVDAFAQQNPNVRVTLTILAAPSTSRWADISISTGWSEAETRTRHVIARHAVALIVNENVPVDAIDIASFRSILDGDTYPLQRIVGDNPTIYVVPSLLTAVPNAQVLPGPREIVAAVAADRRAVGIGLAPEGAGTRALKVRQPDGALVEPNASETSSGHYPIFENVAISTRESPASSTVSFVQWLDRDESRAIAIELGYAPAHP